MDFDVERDEAARGDDELRPVPPFHPAVEDHARVGRLVVLGQEAADRLAAGLLLAVADDAEGHRQGPSRDELLDRLQLHPELALVVGDSSGVEPLPAGLGRERVALPELEWIGGLDVVVAVDEDDRRPRRAGNLGDHEPPVLVRGGLPSERAHLVGDPIGRSRDVPGACRARAHARDREEVTELVEPAGRQEAGGTRRHVHAATLPRPRKAPPGDHGYRGRAPSLPRSSSSVGVGAVIRRSAKGRAW